MEGVEADTQMYPQTIHVDLSVTAMGVVTPEGQLIRNGANLRHSKSTPALAGQSMPGSHPERHVMPPLLAAVLSPLSISAPPAIVHHAVFIITGNSCSYATRRQPVWRRANSGCRHVSVLGE